MKNAHLILLLASGLAAGCAHSVKQTAQSPATNSNAVQQIIPPKSAETTNTKTAVNQTAKPTAIDVFVCSRDGDNREIYIEPLSPSGCKLWYSNKANGPVASSVNGLTHCENVNQKIRKNLEVAGYKCGAVSDTAKK